VGNQMVMGTVRHSRVSGSVSMMDMLKSTPTLMYWLGYLFTKFEL